MVFFSHKCGQLGNRLFSFAHLIANAEERKYKLINLAFDEYAEYFETTANDVLCSYPPRSTGRAHRFFRRILLAVNRGVVKILRTIGWSEGPFFAVSVADLPDYNFHDARYFDLDSDAFQIKLRKPVVFLFGRFFRDYNNCVKHQNIIRDFFRPVKEIESVVLQTMHKARTNSDFVVGVHIRRGDYQSFADGKYFFSWNQYAEQLRALQKAIPHRKLMFVICSNEPVRTEAFSDLRFMIGPGHLVADMYTFSECDVIVGPPSTYTLWASFYGNKPIYQLRDLTQQMSLERFVIPPPHTLFNFSFN